MKLLIVLLWIFSQTSIYSYQITAADGSQIDFNNFRGKKILIVNIATGSPKVGQLEKLEQLYQLYKDSLVIIAFPSNSFGNEASSNADIISICQSSYNTHFLIASKSAVNGVNQQPIYKWLSSYDSNGTTDNIIGQDFQKFLIDKNGSLIGLFAASVDPMSDVIRNSITDSDN